MGHFSVRVMYSNGKPASDVGVMIDYGLLNVSAPATPSYPVSFLSIN
jgi:hypothetical protein